MLSPLLCSPSQDCTSPSQLSWPSFIPTFKYPLPQLPFTLSSPSTIPFPPPNQSILLSTARSHHKFARQVTFNFIFLDRALQPSAFPRTFPSLPQIFVQNLAYFPSTPVFIILLTPNHFRQLSPRSFTQTSLHHSHLNPSDQSSNCPFWTTQHFAVPPIQYRTRTTVLNLTNVLNVLSLGWCWLRPPHLVLRRRSLSRSCLCNITKSKLPAGHFVLSTVAHKPTLGDSCAVASLQFFRHIASGGLESHDEKSLKEVMFESGSRPHSASRLRIHGQHHLDNTTPPSHHHFLNTQHRESFSLSSPYAVATVSPIVDHVSRPALPAVAICHNAACTLSIASVADRVPSSATMR